MPLVPIGIPRSWESYGVGKTAAEVNPILTVLVSLFCLLSFPFAPLVASNMPGKCIREDT